MTTKTPLQKILKRIFYTENESIQTMKGQSVSNHRRGKGRKAESNIDSATHIQTLKQKRQLNDKNHHIPINTNTEC
jgi:hypothetical protein